MSFLDARSTSTEKSVYDSTLEEIGITYEVFQDMALMISPNIENTTLVDGFGHYAKYSRSVRPSLSFSKSGASLSISPTKHLTTADNTHVQIRK